MTDCPVVNSLLKRCILIAMPLTRKQEAREKRSRQSDVMSDIENLDVMLGSFSGNYLEEQGITSEIDIDLESRRRQRVTTNSKWDRIQVKLFKLTVEHK